MLQTDHPPAAVALARHLLDNPGDREPAVIADVLTGGAELVAADAPELARFLNTTADAVREAGAQ